MKKILKISALILFILIMLYLVLGAIIINRPIKKNIHKYSSSDYYLAYNKLSSETSANSSLETKREYYELIKEESHILPFFYSEKNLSNGNGFTIVIARIVFIKSDLSVCDYAISFTHELTHLKKFSTNERFVCFESWKFLYESKNVYLKSLGVKYGLQLLSGQYGGNYNVSDLLIKYLV